MKKGTLWGKRMILLLAVTAMLLLEIAGAQAGTLRVLVDCYDWPKQLEWYKGWVKQHPGDELKVKDSFLGVYQNTEEMIKALEARNAKYSVIKLPTIRADWERVRDTGLLADLSGSEYLKAFVDRMYPVFRELAYDNGRLTGIPCSAFPDNSTGLSCDPSGWEKAGYGKEDVPGSFMELLDFLEGWIERNRKEPTNISVLETYMFDPYTKSSYTLVFTQLFVEQYVNQCLAQGRQPVFNTPETVAILERIARIGEGLYEIDPPENIVTVPPDDWMNWEKYARPFLIYNGWSHKEPDYIIPSRVTEDVPLVYPMQADILFIPQNSPKQEKALEFICHYIRLINETVPTEKMTSEAREYPEWRSMLLADEEAPEAYREMTQHMELSHWDYELPNTQKIYKAREKFAAGKISAGELAGIIDESISEEMRKTAR